MKRISFLLATAALFLFSCSAGNGNESNATTGQQSAQEYDNTLVKGKVTDSIICKKQSSQTYALYLPSNYTAGKKFPCVYFFDSHARGALPLRTYKGLAEKYGFIFIGSNASKNGTQWQVTNEAVEALMEDTRARMNIDPQRIYTSGFSGGSRVAGTVAMIDGGVAGVIGCSAGFPFSAERVQGKFDYFGLAGEDDFNMSEMEQLDITLGGNNFAHQFITFTGKHDWPPVTDFETALLWLQVNAMKENLQQRNNNLITALKNDYEQRISTATKANDLVKAYQLLQGMVSVLKGMVDISSDQKQLEDIAADDTYRKAVTTEEEARTFEIDQQHILAEQITEHDEQWWKSKIAALNKSADNATQVKYAQSVHRILNYLGLASYMNASHALNTGDLPHAVSYVNIFKMIDPKNPDCSYLMAVYYMKAGNPKQAVASLSDAAAAGYNDVGQLITDPIFTSLQGDADFKNVVDTVREKAGR